MKPLKIAYFLSVASGGLGGADHTLFMQAVLMSSQHNVSVILPCDEHGIINKKFQKKCEVFGLEYEIFAYDAAYAIRSINLVEHKKDIDRIERFVLEKRIDILHSVQINPTVELISRKYRIPHVMNIYSLEEWEWRIPCPDIFPQYVCCDSEFYQKKWMSYLNCEGRCVRVYDDIRIDKRQTLNEERPVVIGAAGLVCEYKNYLEVIKAVELVLKKGRKVRLMIAGEDCLSYAACCRDYIELHQLQDSIQLLGFVDDMGSFFEKLDVFICGSRRESFPAAIIEAITCNIPVVSTPIAGIPEILEDGVNGYLSRGYLAEELAEAIERFLDDSETGRLGRILAGEKRTYEGFFSVEAVRGQLEGLYDEMLENTSGVKHFQDMEMYTEKIAQMIKGMEREGLEQEDIRLTYNRLLYLYQIKDIIAGKRCYIWGAGRWGRIIRIILTQLIEDIEIIAFVDESKNNPVGGIKIIKKEEMDIREDTAVLVSFVKGQEEVIAYLEDKNMEIMKNIFIIA